MATTYYVRKTGNDSSNGTSAATAWLTISKALNSVARGDTVYVGAGTYRETVTATTGPSGVTAVSTNYIADIDGSKTGDPGQVIWTAHSADTLAAASAPCIDMNGKDYFT